MANTAVLLGFFFFLSSVVPKMYSLHRLDHPRHSGLVVSLNPGKVFQEKASQNFLSSLLCSAQQKSCTNVHEAAPLQEVTVNYSMERCKFC